MPARPSVDSLLFHADVLRNVYVETVGLFMLALTDLQGGGIVIVNNKGKGPPMANGAPSQLFPSIPVDEVVR